MSNYIKSETDRFVFLINNIDGSSDIINKDKFPDKSELLREIDKKIQLFTDSKPPIIDEFKHSNLKVIYISVHTSTSCNLNCKYCFRDKNARIENLGFQDVKKFIDYMIQLYPNAEKYIVDPTGSAEPLLNLPLVLEIGRYCKLKSDEVSKEVLPMLVTNGVNLTEEIVRQLREAGILFGVSIDGNKSQHNYNRIDYNEKGSYNSILKNVKNIKNRDLLGAAVTLNYANRDIVKALKFLVKFFPAISIKPVRSTLKDGINESNIDEIMNQYDRLYNFLLGKTLVGELYYISAILNGDDYFGKFLTRVIVDLRVSTRCDAGFSRASLDAEKNIYVCPAAIGIQDLIIGTLEEGIDINKQKEIYNLLTSRKNCNNCEAKYVCGGECLVNAYYTRKSVYEKDDTMCKLKKHIFKLCLLFKAELFSRNIEIFKVVHRGCLQKIARFSEDKELKETLKLLEGRMKFTELKKIKDERYNEYLDLRRDLLFGLKKLPKIISKEGENYEN